MKKTWVAALALLIVLLIFAAVTPGHTFVIGAQDFSEADNVRCEADVLVFEPTMPDGSAVESAMLFTGVYALRPGAYDIRIDYRVDKSEPKDFYQQTATFMLDSNQRIEMEAVELSETLTTVHGRVWTPLARRSTDVGGVLIYEGGAVLTIERIVISENIGYRFVCVAALALLLMLLGAVHRLFFSRGAQLPAWAGTAAALAGIALAASLPYLTNFIYESHDFPFHLYRIVSLAEELGNGVFPVRMHTTVNNGYSYPLSLYYGDLLLYLPAILYRCAVPLQTCYQIYTFMINALTCVIAYACMHGMTKHRVLSLLGAALYTLSTYRLCNIYARAAMGEYTAMMFMPLVLLGIYRICEAERPAARDWLPLSLGMTGIVLSHVLSTEMMAFDLVLLCLLFLRRMLKKERLAAIVKAAALCLLLAAWFLVPFVDCFINQRVNIQTVEPLIAKRGTYLVQLLGLSVQGFGYVNKDMRGELPQTIGIALMIGAAVVLYCMYQRRKWNLTESFTFKWMNALLIVAAINLVMTLSAFPWDEMAESLGRFGNVIRSIQFPWRWIAVATPLLTLCTVLAMGQIEKASPKMFPVLLALLAGCMVFGTGDFYSEYIDQMPIYSSYVESAYEVSDDLYLLEDTDAKIIRRSECRVTQGEAEVEFYEKENDVAVAHVCNDSGQEAQITFPVFAYYGYRAFDGEGGELEILSGENNCIAVNIAPQYSGVVSIRFMPPVLWRIAEAVSLGALLLLGVCIRRRKA